MDIDLEMVMDLDMDGGLPTQQYQYHLKDVSASVIDMNVTIDNALEIRSGLHHYTTQNYEIISILI